MIVDEETAVDMLCPVISREGALVRCAGKGCMAWVPVYIRKHGERRVDTGAAYCGMTKEGENDD